jgi:hypothetical protein
MNYVKQAFMFSEDLRRQLLEVEGKGQDREEERTVYFGGSQSYKSPKYKALPAPTSSDKSLLKLADKLTNNSQGSILRTMKNLRIRGNAVKDAKSSI